MARKIRDDFEGVVYVEGQSLKAGDEVPDGAEVGDHLFESDTEEAPEPEAPEPEKPAEKPAAKQAKPSGSEK